MEKIKVFLADDHVLVRKGIRSILEQEGIFEVIGEAENGREAIEKIQQMQPDVAVLDISMPELNGVEVTRQIIKRCPEVKIVILSMYSNDEYLFEVLKSGASGYVLKKSAPEELVAAIHAAYIGHSFLSPEVSKKVTNRFAELSETQGWNENQVLLTEREREVLQLIAEGRPNREIASMLYLSIKTIESHRSNLMGKLNLHNIAELTRYAIEKGII